jgi:thermitase
MMYVSAIWFSASCDARNQNATTTHAFEHPLKSPAPRFLPYEVLVRFKDGISQERIAAILKDNRIDVIAEIQRGRLYHVKIVGDRSVESAITQLASYQEIEYAEPNYRYETQK